MTSFVFASLSFQAGDWGGSTVDSERDGRRADLGLLDGPTSSGVS